MKTSSVVNKFKQFPKRSLYTLIFLVVVLFGGIFALARGGSFNIFASTSTGVFSVTVKNSSGQTLPGVSVWINQGTTNIASGITNSSGIYTS